MLTLYLADDFIINKYRGKSGPMFNFDVHDDVRLTHDAKIEKDEVRRLLLLISLGPSRVHEHELTRSTSPAVARRQGHRAQLVQPEQACVPPRSFPYVPTQS